MSNEVVPFKGSSAEELMKATGQSNGPAYTDFPRLSINKQATDDEDRQLPVGTYVVSQNGVAVYGKPVVFRPFFNLYQYATYDSATNTFTNRSVLFKNFSEEAVDEQGGVACGKISKKNQEGLSPEQLAEQKKIKCYRVMYGLVTFDGVTATDDKVAIESLPVKLRLSGDNFMPIQETLDLLSTKKLPMQTVNLTLTTERRKQGTNVWYRALFTPDLENIVNLGDSDWENLKLFQEAIDRENKAVQTKYRAAKRTVEEPKEEAKIIEALETSLNDDISDV